MYAYVTTHAPTGLASHHLKHIHDVNVLALGLGMDCITSNPLHSLS